MILYPYKPGSESSKALADALGIKRISHRNSRFKGSPDKVVINWGASDVPEEVAKCNILNKPEAVAIACNKLDFFEEAGRMARIPAYTTDIDEARQWYEDGHDILCRTKLNGYGGDGIVLTSEHQGVVEAPLYVLYIPKKSEYRVHVFRGQVVDVQRKARRSDVPDDKINWKIRNMEGGFVFARGEALGDVPEDVLIHSVYAVSACGLDFGAVDVIFNEKHQKAYVLEVNTAPGLSGATLEGYVKRFGELN